MSLTFDMTKQAFVKAMRTGTTHEQTLHIVVLRLLAIALMVTDSRRPQGQTDMLPAPHDYGAWPMVESELGSHGRRQRLRFYVCPNAATLSDDQPFPIGTAFVVETIQIEPIDELLVSRFVMEKYAGVMRDQSDRAQYGAWASATYGSVGDVLSMGKTSCGIRRLSFAWDRP